MYTHRKTIWRVMDNDAIVCACMIDMGILHVRVPQISDCGCAHAGCISGADPAGEGTRIALYG